MLVVCNIGNSKVKSFTMTKPNCHLKPHHASESPSSFLLVANNRRMAFFFKKDVVLLDLFQLMLSQVSQSIISAKIQKNIYISHFKNAFNSTSQQMKHVVLPCYDKKGIWAGFSLASLDWRAGPCRQAVINKNSQHRITWDHRWRQKLCDVCVCVHVGVRACVCCSPELLQLIIITPSPAAHPWTLM